MAAIPSMLENEHVVKGLDPVADAFAGTVYSDIVSMANYQRTRFTVYMGAEATGTTLLTVEPCLNVSGTPGTAIAFNSRAIVTGDTPGALTATASTGLTTVAGGTRIYEVEVNADQLAASGYEFVRLKCVEQVNDPITGCILIHQSCPRYAQDALVTSIV